MEELIAEEVAAFARQRKTIFGYTVRSFVAEGGMGVVYRVVDKLLQRDIALKTIRGNFQADESLRRRFLDEIRLSAQLQHPGIPPVHGAGIKPTEPPFFTMKFVEGQTLRALLDARPSPGHELGRLISLFAQVCQAVGYAHSRGIIHRDLTPQNIMVGAFGEVQVMDWGLAREVGPRVPTTNQPAQPWIDVVPDHQSGGLPPLSTGPAGTPGYMSPEQAVQESDHLTYASDVFSLGAILFEILTGESLYPKHANDDEIVWADLQDALNRLATNAGRLESGYLSLVSLVKDCLNRDPLLRPQTARDLAAQVTAVIEGAAERARRAEVQRQRLKVVVASLGAIVLVTMVLGGCAVWAAREADKQRQVADERLVDTRRLLDLHRTSGANLAASEGRWWVARNRLDEVDTRNRGFVWQLVDKQMTGQSFPMPGCTGDSMTIAMSVDGHQVVTVSADRSIRTWDVRSGRLVLHVNMGPGPPGPAVVFPNGRRVVAPAADGTVAVWDAVTGRMSGVIGQPKFEPDWLAVSADGTRIAGVGRGEVRVWNTSGLELFRTGGEDAPDRSPQSVAISYDGRTIATRSIENACVWDVSSGRRLLEIAGAGGGASGMYDLSLSPDGSTLATADWLFGSARIWDAKTGRMISQFLTGEVTTGVHGAVISPDGATVALYHVDGRIFLADLQTGEILGRYRSDGQTRSNTPLAFSPDGGLLYVAAPTATMFTIEVRESVALDGFANDDSHHPGSPAKHLTLSGDGRRAAAVWEDRVIRVWDTRTRKRLYEIDLQGTVVNDLALSQDGFDVTFVTAPGGDVEVRNIRTGERRRLPVGNPAPRSTRLFAGGTVYAVVDAQATTVISNSGTPLCVGPACSPSQLFGAAGSADGSTVVVGGDGIEVFDARVGTHITFDGFQARGCMCLSPDGRLGLFRRSERTTASTVVCETRTGKSLVRMTESLGATYDMEVAAFSPDASAVVAVGRWNGFLRLFDIQTGQEAAHFRFSSKRRTELNIALSVSDNGIVTASPDGTVRILDAAPSPPNPQTTQCLGDMEQLTARMEGLIRPDAEWHARSRVKYHKTGSVYSAIFHAAWEHRARGLQAMDVYNIDAAFREFLAAELFRGKAQTISW
ncbi:WD40 repeat domain-containing serine/threonine-protein kinase [Fimbriiglobus ruber]|uniref:WD40 repeat domain-containing serine/threonine-protein kinase n=1 Tax=Fimbriiglobus ruber TaxID=1908690 RepID=UPI00137B249C|nr:WD40 repeat domain-containing serine/threonine protein kinase [Fimbriiglobus ruber]